MSEHQHYFIVSNLGQPCGETNEETMIFHYKLFGTSYAIKCIYRMSVESPTWPLIMLTVRVHISKFLFFSKCGDYYKL